MVLFREITNCPFPTMGFGFRERSSSKHLLHIHECAFSHPILHDIFTTIWGNWKLIRLLNDKSLSFFLSAILRWENLFYRNSLYHLLSSSSVTVVIRKLTWRPPLSFLLGPPCFLCFVPSSLSLSLRSRPLHCFNILLFSGSILSKTPKVQLT